MEEDDLFKDDTTFKVVVKKDVKLSEENLRDLSEKLKTIFLAELAKIDNHGDFKAKPLPTARKIGGGTTAGMIIENKWIVRKG